MILFFPQQATLQLALTSGVIPEAVSLAPAEAAFGEQGETWVQPAASLPRASTKKLADLGVTAHRKAPQNLTLHVGCWLQLLPLAGSGELTIGDKTPVLFELEEEASLPEMVNEMLRLGNDRQSYRRLRTGQQTRTLLRVIGPPYYSLLRAVERDRQGAGPRAYVERSPRVWIELGYEHPLSGNLQPPPGQLLLIRAARDWRFIDEVKFHDIYEILEFPLPQGEVAWSETKLQERLRVPLRLTAGGGSEAAELWVLDEDPVRQIEQLVHSADDELLSRLAFAVAARDEHHVVVLRARPSKKAPPVLVLRGVAYRSYLKLPHLFVPVGQRLHPPLRRDAVAKRLVRDRQQITWLHPGAQGSFTPQSLPDAAFRPLEDWIDYILDCEHEALQAWAAAHRFDFESFVCYEDQAARPKGRPRQRIPPRESAGRTAGVTPSDRNAPHGQEGRDIEDEALDRVTDPETPADPSQQQTQLRELEARFRESDAALDSPQRSRLWRELAVACAALQHRRDATVCWSNSLWEETSPPATSLAAWLSCERTSTSRGAGIEELDKLLNKKASMATSGAMVAAYLVWAAHQEQPPPELTPRLGALARYLQRHESELPVRTAWLAWCSLVRLSAGDVLALARARDRILERLYQHGLRPEFDLPTFLRAGDEGSSERFRAVRDQVLRLRELVSKWIVEPIGTDPQTVAYSNLVFAFALARLGETAECRKLVADVERAFAGKDKVHLWIRDAYRQRIDQALGGEPAASRLDERLLANLETMDRLDRYKVDKLRQHSRILEPHERVDPYRRWHRHYTDELSRELAGLSDLNDRDELRNRVAQLLEEPASAEMAVARKIRILTSALELSTRLGEAFAGQLLNQVLPALRPSRDPVEHALLLEKALFIAAHYGQSEHVRALVGRFEKSLPAIVSTFLTLRVEHDAENKEKLDTLEALFTKSFQELRRLGMRDEIGRLFGQVADLLHRAQRQRKRRRKDETDEDANRINLLLLIVAGGWYYFGQQEQAVQVADEVRKTLFAGTQSPRERKNLACAYVRAVGQAPVEVGLPRIEELFQFKVQGKQRNLPGISDNLTTSSHFSLSQLDLIEDVVLALASEDFTLNAESRRWLDEDEFLVRRRIHRDVRQAVE